MVETAATPPQPTSSRRRLWRDWLVPRSVLGITSLLLTFSIGASLSGVSLYAYYEYRLTNTEKRIDNYIKGFDERFRTASETIDAEKQNAQAAVQKELDPLRQFQAEGGTLAALLQKIGGAVWFVQTLDEQGAPSVGSAFVVASNDKESVLVTSLATVKAATRAPGPEINVSKNNDKFKGRLDNWVEDQDLAVLTIPKGRLAKLDFVPVDKSPRIGERTFAVSGLGSTGASVTQGFISDVSKNVLQHDAAIGPSFQGGPMVNSEGQVTGVASLKYSPIGIAPESGVHYSLAIQTTCEKLLKCPNTTTVSGSNPR